MQVRQLICRQSRQRLEHITHRPTQTIQGLATWPAKTPSLNNSLTGLSAMRLLKQEKLTQFNRANKSKGNTHGPHISHRFCNDLDLFVDWK